jgi:hypothetical protein
VSKNPQSGWWNPPLGTLDTPDINARKDNKGEGRKVFGAEGNQETNYGMKEVYLSAMSSSCFKKPRSRGFRRCCRKCSFA